MRYSVLLFVAAVVVGLGSSVATATPPIPTLGTAVVDGQYGEWDLTNDFFANMYRTGDSTKALESKLYLRYDCETATQYVLVLCEPGIPGYIDSTATTSWIAIDNHNAKFVNEMSGDDGVPPDFAWVGRGYDGNPQHMQGFEASFYLMAGTCMIFASMDVWDDDFQQTSCLVGHPWTGAELVIPCAPTATEATSFGAIKALYR
jgi:hypothetical protein